MVNVNGISSNSWPINRWDCLVIPQIPYTNILIPSSTCHNVWIIRTKFDWKNSVIVSMAMPFHTTQFWQYFLCFFVIKSDNIVFSTCCKLFPIFGIVQGQDVVIFFYPLEKLFSCLSCVLEKMSIRICDQKDRTDRSIISRGWSPPKRIYRNFFIVKICIYFTNLASGIDVINLDHSITVTTSNKEIFKGKFSTHHFSLFLDYALHYKGRLVGFWCLYPILREKNLYFCLFGFILYISVKINITYFFCDNLQWVP